MIVKFQPEGKRVEVSEKETILDAALKAGIPIESICGGKGVCGKCKVKILKGKLDVTPEEERHLTDDEIQNRVRLACKVFATQEIVCEVIAKSLKQRILVEGISKKIPVNPNVKKFHLILPPPTLEVPKSYLTLIKESISSIKVEEIDFEAIKKLPSLMKEYNNEITVVTLGNRIVDFEGGNTENKCFGIAFDIGTTTVVGYLVDLRNGEEIANASIMNPQIQYGDDVISRINFSLEKGSEKLQEEILKGLNFIIEKIVEKSGVSKNKIYEVSVVGNTAMHHLFLGIPTHSLAFSPYVPVVKDELNISSQKLKLPGKNTYILPVIAGFVGADTVGALLSAKFDKKLRMLIDIGTNCEIVLGTKEKILACSAAAGPAFEGAHIRHGMRAAPGAISSLKIKKDVEFETIGGESPRGITGSGLIDAIAEMLKKGIITRMGKITQENEFRDRIRKGKDGLEFVIFDNIAITQRDVREIQLAKGAIFTAIRILSKEYGVSFSEISEIFLAGAFGTYIPKRSAQVIGMIPDIPLDRIKGIGNAAGTGAKMALISKGERKKARKISEEVIYIEISGRKDFQHEFMDAMIFPHADMKLFPSVKLP